jgi:hypothetical protein
MFCCNCFTGSIGPPETCHPPIRMSVLVSAAPLYLSIGTGLFSLYSISTFCSLGSRRLTSLCFLVPFLLVVDSIVALVVLGNTSASLGLAHAEFVLQVVVRLSRQFRINLAICEGELTCSLVNLLNALILHPSTLPLFLARPAFGYKFQTVAVATLAIVATCCNLSGRYYPICPLIQLLASIFEAITSVSTVIPSMVSFVGLIVPPLIFALLLRVAVVSRKWNSSPSNSGWDLLAAQQLPALAMSIARAWPTDTVASTVGHFCLFFWTTGTLLSILREFMCLDSSWKEFSPSHLLKISPPPVEQSHRNSIMLPHDVSNIPPCRKTFSQIMTRLRGRSVTNTVIIFQCCLM